MKAVIYHIVHLNWGYLMHEIYIKYKKRDCIPIEYNYSNKQGERKLGTFSSTAVYMAMFGSYDRIQNPEVIDRNCDYYIISDQKKESYQDSIWQKYDISSFENEIRGLTNAEKNRFFKMHPHLLFSKYKYSIYLDSNLKIIKELSDLPLNLEECDIGMFVHPRRDSIYDEIYDVMALKKAKKKDLVRQVERYKKEGFPYNFGLFENNFIVRKHNEQNCIELMEFWWKEYMNGCRRDQLSFTYCLWKMGWKISGIKALGKDIKTSGFIKYCEHR